ncbi:MAG: hypothetical protein AB7N76_26255 [Planctomycetota bacterium]
METGYYVNLDDLVDQVVEERSFEALERLTGSRSEAVLDALVEAAGRLLGADEPDDADDEIIETIRLRLVETKATGPLIDALHPDADPTTQEFAMSCLAEIGDMIAFEPMLRLLREGRKGAREVAAGQLTLLTNYDFGMDAEKWREWSDRRLAGQEAQEVEDREDLSRRLNLRMKGTNVTEGAGGSGEHEGFHDFDSDDDDHY